MKDTWEILAFYESRDLLHRTYEERFGQSPISNKVEEITYHLAQGREYFSSAKQSALLVRPLLLYYGVLALSRALILFLDSKRERELKQGHGVEIPNWKNVLHRESKKQSINKLAELKLKFVKGTFTDLSQATKNEEQAEFVWINTYRRWQKNGTTKLEPGYEITLKEVLARIQDIADLFTVTFRERSCCYPAIIRGLSEQIDVHVSSEYVRRNLELPNMDILSKCEICKIFPMFRDAKQDSDGAYRFGYGESCDKLPPIRNNQQKNAFLVAPLSNGDILSSLSFLYLISYATGMLARYYPSQWGRLIHGSKGDWLFPLIKSVLTIVEERFPELTLLTLEWAGDRDLEL